MVNVFQFKSRTPFLIIQAPLESQAGFTSGTILTSFSFHFLAGNLSFGDFITISTKSGKKSKGKNKNRKSDSALLEQKKITPIPFPELPHEEGPEESKCEILEEPIVFAETPTAASRITATPQKFPTATPQKFPTAAPHEQFENEINITTIPQKFPTFTPQHLPQNSVENETAAVESETVNNNDSRNGVVRSFNISSSCDNDERASPLRIVRPNFDRRDSLSEFLEPDPTKVTKD